MVAINRLLIFLTGVITTDSLAVPRQPWIHRRTMYDGAKDYKDDTGSFPSFTTSPYHQESPGEKSTDSELEAHRISQLIKFSQQNPYATAASSPSTNTHQHTLNKRNNAGLVKRSIASKIRNAFRKVKEKFQQVGKAIKKGFSKVKEGFQKAGKAIKKGFSKVKEGFQKAGKVIKKGFQTVGKAIKKGAEKVKNGIVKAAKWVNNKVIKPVGKFVKKHWKDIVITAGGALLSAVSLGTLTPVVAAASAAARVGLSVGTKIASVVSKAKNVASTVKTAIKGSKAVEKVKEVANKAKKVHDKAEKVNDRVQSVSSASSAVSSVKSSIKAKPSGAAPKIKKRDVPHGAAGYTNNHDPVSTTSSTMPTSTSTSTPTTSSSQTASSKPYTTSSGYKPTAPTTTPAPVYSS